MFHKFHLSSVFFWFSFNIKSLLLFFCKRSFTKGVHLFKILKSELFISYIGFQNSNLLKSTSNPIAHVRMSCIALLPDKDYRPELPGWKSELCYSCSSLFCDATICCSLGQFVHVEQMGYVFAKNHPILACTFRIANLSMLRFLIFVFSCDSFLWGVENFTILDKKKNGKVQN